jgi:hypothetical protein
MITLRFGSPFAGQFLVFSQFQQLGFWLLDRGDQIQLFHFCDFAHEFKVGMNIPMNSSQVKILINKCAGAWGFSFLESCFQLLQRGFNIIRVAVVICSTSLRSNIFATKF